LLAIARSSASIFSDPRAVMLELVLAAQRAMKRACWPEH